MITGPNVEAQSLASSAIGDNKQILNHTNTIFTYFVGNIAIMK